jgi:hypothetical protein
VEVDYDVLWPELDAAKFAHLLVPDDLLGSDLVKMRIQGTYVLLHNLWVKQNVL